jgi:hypothetical protein
VLEFSKKSEFSLLREGLSRVQPQVLTAFRIDAHFLISGSCDLKMAPEVFNACKILEEEICSQGFLFAAFSIWKIFVRSLLSTLEKSFSLISRSLFIRCDWLPVAVIGGVVFCGRLGCS